MYINAHKYVCNYWYILSATLVRVKDALASIQTGQGKNGARESSQ